MSSFKKYDTLTPANAGVRMLIKDHEGKDTEDWIHVLGVDSSSFQRANRKMRRTMLGFLEDKGIGAKDSEAYFDMMVVEQAKLQASLVAGWSFEEPCTAENVTELFTNAPNIAQQVDETASKRGLFVKA